MRSGRPGRPRGLRSILGVARACFGNTAGVPKDDHEAFLREVAETQERLALDLERNGAAVEFAKRAWERAAAARERAEAAQRRREQHVAS
jgi:hypothetical protein